MKQSAINRRISQVPERIPTSCPACRNLPPLVILQDEDPDPPMSCSRCGRVITERRIIRFVRVERGPE